jgi:hypothetical protein
MVLAGMPPGVMLVHELKVSTVPRHSLPSRAVAHHVVPLNTRLTAFDPKSASGCLPWSVHVTPSVEVAQLPVVALNP